MSSNHYGFYSAKGANSTGSMIFLDLDGNEQEVTMISLTNDSSHYRWDDTIPKGIVTTFVRKEKVRNLTRCFC